MSWMEAGIDAGNLYREIRWKMKVWTLEGEEGIYLMQVVIKFSTTKKSFLLFLFLRKKINGHVNSGEILSRTKRQAEPQVMNRKTNQQEKKGSNFEIPHFIINSWNLLLFIGLLSVSLFSYRVKQKTCPIWE